MQNLPNDPELVILKVLWAHGSMSVRKLHDCCEAKLNWSFSSTRKTIDRMGEKNFLKMNRDISPVLVEARVSKSRVIAQYSRDFFGRVLEVNRPIPMSAFADSQVLSDDDLDEIKGLLSH